MSIVWKNEYSVQVEEIDAQHKKLFAIINGFYYTLNHKQAQNIDCEKIYNELVKYGEEHFTLEEKYFEEFNYENRESHIEEHQKYRKRISECKSHIGEDHLGHFFEILDFLEDWWVDHVTNIDMQYVECFRKNGLH